MKVVQVNTVYKKGSTGKIVEQIQMESNANGIKNIVAYRYSEGTHYANTYTISTWLDCHIHNRLSKYTQKDGFYSKLRTWKFLRYLDKESPDIVHIHNIHGAYINIPMLFRYLIKHNIKTIWTLHDCWSFTGNCPYYDISKCEKWLNGCKDCSLFKSIICKEQSSKNWNIKKALYSIMENLLLVTPSSWLAHEVKRSFLCNHKITVINNGIDLDIFKPRPSKFREQFRIPKEKKILLGIAFCWGIRKGLDVFIELYNRLDKDKYQIVLVGTNDEVDKQLSKNIISIHHTNNQQELAEIYSACDLFVNPTREDNYPTVNLESIACGTPVLTFRTGGSPEMINDLTGSVVDCDDIDGLEREIIRIANEHPFKKEDCIEHAKSFDMNIKFKEYIDLYNEITSK